MFVPPSDRYASQGLLWRRSLPVLFFMVSIFLCGAPSLSHAKDDEKDFSYKILGKTVPTYQGRLDRDLTKERQGRPGMFQGKFIGCKDRQALLAYYRAKAEGNQALMNKIKSQGRCVPLAGRSYRPLIVGFDTSAVMLGQDRSNTITWVMTLALVAAPPPSRPSFYQYK